MKRMFLYRICNRNFFLFSFIVFYISIINEETDGNYFTNLLTQLKFKSLKKALPQGYILTLGALCVRISVGDGIAHVHGLSQVQAGETVAFSSDVQWMALNLKKPTLLLAKLTTQEVHVSEKFIEMSRRRHHGKRS